MFDLKTGSRVERGLLIGHALIWAAVILATSIMLSKTDTPGTYATYLLTGVLVPSWWASQEILRRALRNAGGDALAFAHITGGGWVDNIPRAPEANGARRLIARLMGDPLKGTLDRVQELIAHVWTTAIAVAPSRTARVPDPARAWTAWRDGR